MLRKFRKPVLRWCSNLLHSPHLHPLSLHMIANHNPIGAVLEVTGDVSIEEAEGEAARHNCLQKNVLVAVNQDIGGGTAHITHQPAWAMDHIWAHTPIRHLIHHNLCSSLDFSTPAHCITPPINLMGRDILIKCGASILCGSDGIIVTVPNGTPTNCAMTMIHSGSQMM